MPHFAKRFFFASIGLIGCLTAAPIRVGIDLDGEPMTLVDGKGVPQGFAVDIMNAIGREMNLEIVYVAKPWAEMFEDFKAGRTDALANITYTDERARIVEFTDPHIVMTGAIFVRKGDTSIRSAVDLRNRRVAVKLGGAPHQYLEAH
ncbi:MAG: transporter substrate-binding domain-containing protein, partial [Opitutaceae bacterium]